MIVDAAIVRVERHGLDALSARKLAQDLGCEAMSLYHHVGNMETLKDAMVDKLLGSIRPAITSEPVDALRQEAESFLALAETHPRNFQLIATRRWKGSQAIGAAGRTVSRFSSLGFKQDEALARARMLGAYLNGAGLALAAWQSDSKAALEDVGRVGVDLGRGVALLINSLIKPS